MTAQEATQKINDLNTQVEKIKTEVQTLIDTVNNNPGTIPAEVEAAINQLAATVQGVDDMNPDATEPGPVEPVPGEDETV